MTRYLLPAAALLAVMTSAAAAEERILVADLLGHHAELIDPATRQVLAVTPVGQQPVTAAVTPDRRYGLVASQGFFAGPLSNGSVAVLDINATGMPVVTTLSLNTQPFGLAVAPDSRTAVVTRVNTQYQVELLLLDLTTSPPTELGKPVVIPKALSACNVDITPDGKTALSVDGSMLSVIDLTRSPPVVTHQLATSADSFFCRLSNDGRRLVVVSKHSPSRAEVWNVETLPPAKTGDVVIGGNSAGATPGVDPGNRFAAVANSGAQTLHVIDAHALPPVQLGSVDSLGQTLRGVTVTPDGLRAWSAARSDKKLVEVDLSDPRKPLRTGNVIWVSGSGPESLVAFGPVHAHGVPGVGSAHPIFVSSPAHPAKAYALAASFGTRPGIPIGSRTVPLNPDLLFFLSQALPTVFKNFAGTLNLRGQAVAVLDIPAAPALRGLSLYVAGLILDPAAPQGIGTVTNAEHVVIQ